MEILGYYFGIDLHIHSHNGIISDVYIYEEDRIHFTDVEFIKGLNPTFIHVVEPIEFIKKLFSKIYIPLDDLDEYENSESYNIEVENLIKTMSEL
jgi:hypothetical protein